MSNGKGDRWIGYVQTTTRVVSSRSMPSMALAMHWARRRAIKLAGGVNAIADMTAENEPFVRKRFEEDFGTIQHVEQASLMDCGVEVKRLVMSVVEREGQ